MSRKQVRFAGGMMVKLAILAFLMLLVACANRAWPGADSTAAERAARDLLGGPCTGDEGLDPCLDLCCVDGRLQRCVHGDPNPYACSPPSGDTACLQGRVYNFQESSEAPVRCEDRVEVQAFDAPDLLSAPLAARSLGSFRILGSGYFVLPQIKVPPHGHVALRVDDGAGGSDRFHPTATILTVAKGTNNSNVEIPLVTKQLAAAWGNELHEKGTLLVSFVDQATRAPVSGVRLLRDGTTPPWPGAEVRYFGLSAEARPYFQSATKTGLSGMVAVTNAPLGSYSGEKPGCQVSTLTAASVPGLFTFAQLFLSGC